MAIIADTYYVQYVYDVTLLYYSLHSTVYHQHGDGCYFRQNDVTVTPYIQNINNNS